jgi:hypothetical protein
VVLVLGPLTVAVAEPWPDPAEVEVVKVPLLPIPTLELDAVESGMLVVGAVERGIVEVVNVLLEVGQ